MKLLTALVQYLKLSNESLTDFRKEILRLTDADKAWLRQAFIDQGIAIV